MINALGRYVNAAITETGLRVTTKLDEVGASISQFTITDDIPLLLVQNPVLYTPMNNPWSENVPLVILAAQANTPSNGIVYTVPSSNLSMSILLAYDAVALAIQTVDCLAVLRSPSSYCAFVLVVLAQPLFTLVDTSIKFKLEVSP